MGPCPKQGALRGQIARKQAQYAVMFLSPHLLMLAMVTEGKKGAGREPGPMHNSCMYPRWTSLYCVTE